MLNVAQIMMVKIHGTTEIKLRPDLHVFLSHSNP
jgi:hypothetical protein